MPSAPLHDIVANLDMSLGWQKRRPTDPVALTLVDAHVVIGSTGDAIHGLSEEAAASAIGMLSANG